MGCLFVCLFAVVVFFFVFFVFGGGYSQGAITLLNGSVMYSNPFQKADKSLGARGGGDLRSHSKSIIVEIKMVPN